VIWQHAYATPQLLPWMLEQHLRGAACNFADLPPSGAETRRNR
jgi:hypothetical protein